MRAARQLVGGPADGRTVRGASWSGVYHVPVAIDPACLTVDGPVHVSDMFDFRHVTYTPAVAPTGERVLLAPDATWPERFDTEAWPRRVAASVTTARGGPWSNWQPISHWRRLGPWLWRGDARDPERACPDGNCPGRYEYTVYLLGVPEPHPGRSRHDPPKRFDWVATHALSHLVAPRELALAAIAGQRTAEDNAIEEVRHQADALRTPWCPQPMCSRKATVRVGGWARSGGHGDPMCPEHAQQEMGRFDRHYVGSWGVTHQASPANIFRINSLGT